jgi:periplasmic divalent cation tolerance protein
VVILVAYPSRASATRAARELVRGRFLACATVHPGATAFYRWKGRYVKEPITLLWGKSTSGMASRAAKAIRALHPDEVPEILVLRVEGGNAEYVAWLADSVGGAR